MVDLKNSMLLCFAASTSAADCTAPVACAHVPSPARISCEPSIPTPRLDRGWLDRFAMNRRRICESGGEIDIVFLGDSITHYWEVGEGSDTSTEIVELRKTYSILNCAYGGDRTENQLWLAQNGLLDGYKTKLAMMMIGSNNSGAGVAPRETFEGIKALVATIRAKQPQAKILLLDIFPRGTATSPAHRLNREVNALIDAEKWDDAVTVMDLGAKFVDEKGDTIPELFDAERLHLMDMGYALWRKAVEPVFKDVVGKYASPTSTMQQPRTKRKIT